MLINKYNLLLDSLKLKRLPNKTEILSYLFLYTHRILYILNLTQFLFFIKNDGFILKFIKFFTWKKGS